jgi:hypothetical protein
MALTEAGKNNTWLCDLVGYEWLGRRQKTMSRKQTIDPFDRQMTAAAIDTLRRHPARVAKLTELMLTGESWREVRKTMLLTHSEFMDLLGAAVYKAHVEALQDPDVGCLGPFHWPRDCVEPSSLAGRGGPSGGSEVLPHSTRR